MNVSKNPAARRVVRAAITGTIMAATMAVTALPALADTTKTAEGNSPGEAANLAAALCQFYTDYNATEVLSVWRFVDEKGATRFGAQVRCYNA